MLFIQPTVTRIREEGLKQGKAQGCPTTVGATWGHNA